MCMRNILIPIALLLLGFFPLMLLGLFQMCKGVKHFLRIYPILQSEALIFFKLLNFFLIPTIFVIKTNYKFLTSLYLIQIVHNICSIDYFYLYTNTRQSLSLLMSELDLFHPIVSKPFL